MTGKAAVSFDDIMFTSIDSEDFLVNEEKPPLTPSWSSGSDDDADVHWKSSNSSLSQIQSPPKQSKIPVSSTPKKCTSINETKFVTCHNVSNDSIRSLSRVNLNEVLEKTADEMNGLNSSPNPRSRRSFSLHDLDNVFEFPSNKLAKNAVSCEMSHSFASSKTRSKDSGIHRTASCVSLSSNHTCNRKYDHVQSKVKQYIQNMKELGNKSRQLKNAPKPSVLTSPEPKINVVENELTEEKFKELKDELLEKDILISTYHEKYIDLQIKYANIKQKYDALRFGASFKDDTPPLDETWFSADEASRLDSSKFTKSNYFHQSTDTCQPSSLQNFKSLKPITRIHSTSLNLGRHWAPLQPAQNIKESVDQMDSCNQNTSQHHFQSNLGILESSECRGEDPIVKVKRWQESLVSSKVKNSFASKNCDSGENLVKNRNLSSTHEPEVHIFNGIASSSPERVVTSDRSLSRQSSGYESRSNRLQEDSEELQSYKFVRSTDQKLSASYSNVEEMVKAEVKNSSNSNQFLSNYQNADPNAKIADNIFSEPGNSIGINEVDSAAFSRHDSVACSSANKFQEENVKHKTKKTNSRRKVKKSKQDMPDVILNHSKNNPVNIEDLCGIDSMQNKMTQITIKNTFIPTDDFGRGFRRIPQPDMVPFSSTTMKNGLNVNNFNSSKSLTNQKSKEISPNQNSSHRLVPTTHFSSPNLNSSVETITNGKSNKSALCCCLEASDQYINQLNEGLDKLMTALTDLGTSSVFKS